MTKENKLFIPVVLGTAREGRQSIKVAKFVHTELLARKSVETELIDVIDYSFPRTVPSWEKHDTAKRWRDVVSRADGFIIVTPEYNRGYPGELKQLLDSAYEEYEKKPVALVGVSDGRFGGSATIAHITPVLVELGLVVLRGAVRVSHVDELFDEKDVLKEPELYQKSLAKLFDSLMWYTRALKEARDKK